MQMIALTGPGRRWEPRRLRLRNFAVAGRIVRGGRRLRLRLAERWPWTGQITAATARLQALPGANQPEPPQRPGRKTRQGPWNPAHPAKVAKD
jgi:Transposase DDE domain group 1